MASDGRGNADKEERTGGDTVIPSAALDALVAALTSAITTAVATAVARKAAAPGAPATARKVIMHEPAMHEKFMHASHA